MSFVQFLGPGVASSLSRRISLARKARERTAASLIPSIAATSRGAISSSAESTNAFRSWAGKAETSRSRVALSSWSSRTRSAPWPGAISFSAAFSLYGLVVAVRFRRSTATRHAILASHAFWS